MDRSVSHLQGSAYPDDLSITVCKFYGNVSKIFEECFRGLFLIDLSGDECALSRLFGPVSIKKSNDIGELTKMDKKKPWTTQFGEKFAKNGRGCVFCAGLIEVFGQLE
jgi:hypothetical protein